MKFVERRGFRNRTDYTLNSSTLPKEEMLSEIAKATLIGLTNETLLAFVAGLIDLQAFQARKIDEAFDSMDGLFLENQCFVGWGGQKGHECILTPSLKHFS